MSIDQAFVRAIYTIKAVSRGQSGLSRPSDESRVKLYGLYKQATEGDVEGIVTRPEGDSPQAVANQRKWEAWKSQEGLAKSEAKLEYVGYLLETMKEVSPQNFHQNPQWSELERVYLQARTQPLVESPPSSIVATPGASLAGSMAGSMAGTIIGGGSLAPNPQHNRANSMASHYSAYSQFLRRPNTYSEYGLSERDRQEQLNEGLTDSLNVDQDVSVSGNWRQEIAWQLENINDEINSIRRRYSPFTTNAANARSLSHGGSGRNSIRNEAITPEPTDAPGPRVPTSWQIILYYAKILGLEIANIIRRVVLDSAGVILFLVLVKAVASQPAILQQIPLTRRAIELIGRIIATILREIGFEVKPLAKR